jgi:CHAD domain-containing protein
MKAETLQRELKKKLRRLEMVLEEPGSVTRHHEDLHRFRVSLKEWRAALHLLHAVDAGFPYQDIQVRFRPVFAAAGELRFWQLQRGFLRASLPLAPGFEKAYDAHIRKRLHAARKVLLDEAAAAEWPSWRVLKPAVRHACECVTRHSLRAYFSGLAQQMLARKAVLSRRRRRELHELRQWLREYADNRKLAVRRMQFDPGAPAALAPDCVALQALVGNWHDRDVAARQLAADLRTGDFGADAESAGRAVLRAWKKTERAMWDQVIADLASV